MILALQPGEDPSRQCGHPGTVSKPQERQYCWAVPGVLLHPSTLRGPEVPSAKCWRCCALCTALPLPAACPCEAPVLSQTPCTLPALLPMGHAGPAELPAGSSQLSRGSCPTWLQAQPARCVLSPTPANKGQTPARAGPCQPWGPLSTQADLGEAEGHRATVLGSPGWLHTLGHCCIHQL